MTDTNNLEAQILRSALRAIADGRCPDPVHFATEALRTLADCDFKGGDVLVKCDGIMNWDHATVSDRAKAAPYDFRVTRVGEHQFAMRISQSGVAVDDLAGTPLLDAFIEISHGVPCMHVGNDPYDAPLMSVFFNEFGLLVRHDSGELMPASHAPCTMTDLIAKVGQCDSGTLYLQDTKKKYAPEPGDQLMIDRSEAIRTEYWESGCSSDDVDHAIALFMQDCAPLFGHEDDAFKFLMENDTPQAISP